MKLLGKILVFMVMIGFLTAPLLMLLHPKHETPTLKAQP